jgi:hypothetical protein
LRKATGCLLDIRVVQGISFRNDTFASGKSPFQGHMARAVARGVLHQPVAVEQGQPKRPRDKPVAFFIFGGTVKDRMDLERIVFIGRTFGEYAAMFALDEASLGRGPVLDCAAGPSSFTTEARAMGIEATACDVLYGLTPRELYEKGRADLSHVFDQKFDGAAHLYTWTYYKGKDDVIARRERALELFRADYPVGLPEGRYVRAELPHLPFPDGAFELVLSSHFLFLYGDRLDVDFHTASLRELIRVASGEVRIFPLDGLDAKPCPYMDNVLSFLDGKGIRTEIIEVPFEFQKGANKMLRLSRKEEE